MYRLKLNDHDLTYTVSEVQDDKDNTWDFVFTKKPEGILYLVRVEGKTGDSRKTEPKHWDVEIFQDTTQAETLADRIDFTYDLWQHLNRDLIGDVPKERMGEIEGITKLVNGMSPKEKRAYFDARINRIEYPFEDETLIVSPSWQGYFEALYEVKIIEVDAENNARKRWRRRSH